MLEDATFAQQVFRVLVAFEQFIEQFRGKCHKRVVSGSVVHFQQLPFSAQPSDFIRYEAVEEVFADIEQGYLWVSVETYDSDLYPNPFYGFAFLAIHDYDHYLTDSDFSLEGEITAYQAAASRAPSLEIQKILYSEIVLRATAHLYLGHASVPKLVFP